MVEIELVASTSGQSKVESAASGFLWIMVFCNSVKKISLKLARVIRVLSIHCWMSWSLCGTWNPSKYLTWLWMHVVKAILVRQIRNSFQASRVAEEMRAVSIGSNNKSSPWGTILGPLSVWVKGFSTASASRCQSTGSSWIASTDTSGRQGLESGRSHYEVRT